MRLGKTLWKTAWMSPSRSARTLALRRPPPLSFQHAQRRRFLTQAACSVVPTTWLFLPRRWAIFGNVSPLLSPSTQPPLLKRYTALRPPTCPNSCQPTHGTTHRCSGPDRGQRRLISTATLLPTSGRHSSKKPGTDFQCTWIAWNSVNSTSPNRLPNKG